MSKSKKKKNKAPVKYMSKAKRIALQNKPRTEAQKKHQKRQKEQAAERKAALEKKLQQRDYKKSSDYMRYTNAATRKFLKENAEFIKEVSIQDSEINDAWEPLFEAEGEFAINFQNYFSNWAKVRGVRYEDYLKTHLKKTKFFASGEERYTYHTFDNLSNMDSDMFDILSQHLGRDPRNMDWKYSKIDKNKYSLKSGKYQIVSNYTNKKFNGKEYHVVVYNIYFEGELIASGDKLI